MRRRADAGVVRRVAALVVALTAALTATPVLGHDPPAGAGNPERGIVEVGLEPADPDGRCKGYGFELHNADGAAACSHGPDPAPLGIDVRAPRSLAQHHAALNVAGPGGGVQGSPSDGTVECVGYGTFGRRVVAIYAYESPGPSRYSEVAPLIREWADDADGIFDASAAQTGGSRHLRWEHDPGCVPIVYEAVLSSNAVVDLGAMMNELAAQGFNRPDRRYLVWFDVDYLCGVAVNVPDDSPDQNNLNNGVPTGIVHFGRVDNGCWGNPEPKTLVEAHEIMHTLGAVQSTSPYSSSVHLGGGLYQIYGHCVDEYEEMCYADGSPKPIIERCPESNERFFDCGHDDYFHTGPPPGSYLATRWNTANSSFLVTVDPVGGFLDVDGSPFAVDIGWIKSSGITAGCTADGESYCPTATVTREQMASFLVRGLGLPPTPFDFFTDDEASIHEDDINRLAAAGVGTGCGGGRFCPTQVVNREQMASFLVRGFTLGPTDTDFFTDDENSLHESDINRLAASAITGGCGGTNYCPTVAVTRDQMAAFLHRALT